jgi:hypothetical protein
VKEVAMTLIESLQSLPDYRCSRGQRFPLMALLQIAIMAMMSGKYQYREISRFAKNHQDYLLKRLGLKCSFMPSHVTIRAMMQRLDFEQLQERFHSWAKSYVDIGEQDWLCLDGKAVKSTVSDYSSSYQNFLSLVSVFSQRMEQVIHVEKLENKKASNRWRRSVKGLYEK